VSRRGEGASSLRCLVDRCLEEEGLVVKMKKQTSRGGVSCEDEEAIFKRRG